MLNRYLKEKYNKYSPLFVIYTISGKKLFIYNNKREKVGKTINNLFFRYISYSWLHVWCEVKLFKEIINRESG